MVVEKFGFQVLDFVASMLIPIDKD